ncbi:GH20372 [Drosophila grimshawi]|uniref:GH20372 n=2 Tax=Drosophila grimshawi TaxID=7222 RepID=B4J407_DROGR|nr:GH20372 [Drosophila grimshawi]
MNMIRNVSTLNHTCPYVGKQMLKDLYVTPKDFRLPLPNGEYALLLTWIFDKKPQASTNVYFSFLMDIYNE